MLQSFFDDVRTTGLCRRRNQFCFFNFVRNFLKLFLHVRSIFTHQGLSELLGFF